MATDKFLTEAQVSVPADTVVSRDIGSKIAKNEVKKSFLHQCPFCHTLIVPGVSSVSTISKNKLKKSKRYYPVVKLLTQSSKQSKKHFTKIHCKICKKSHLVPCSVKPNYNQASSSVKPLSAKSTPSSAKITPRRQRRKSHDLKSLFKQTTPITPPTPSLLDFLF